MKKEYDVRVEGNPWVSLLSAVIMQARADATGARASLIAGEAEDALRGIEEWREMMEIEVSLSDTYLHDREHGIKI